MIGHRGAAEAAPENTLASFREAKRQGAAWVEFDAKLSADNRAFLLHDDNLDRTSNGKGPARALSYDEIRAWMPAAGRHAQFAGEKMPLLAEALSLFAQEDLQFNLELKPCPGRARDTAKIVLDELNHLWPAAKPKPLISSFVLECLEIARDQAPELSARPAARGPSGQLAGPGAESQGRHGQYLGPRRDPEWAAEIKAEGYGLLVYTVNDAARAKQLIDWGVDGVFTDAPGRILAAVGQ